MLLTLAATAFAQVPCAPPASGAGTIEIPTDFPSIQAAVAALGSGLDGTTIQLLPGVHDTNAAINGYDVTIEGAGCGATVLFGIQTNTLAFDDSTSEIRNLTFQAEPGARGVFANDSTVTFTDTCFEGLGVNGAIAAGAGVYVTDSDVCMEGSRVERSRADTGAGLYAEMGPGNQITLQDTLFLDNVGQDGGGAYVNGGTLDVVRGLFLDNIAASSGGGLRTVGTATHVRDSWFEQNQATRGGAHHDQFGQVSVQNGEYRANQARQGGAVFAGGQFATFEQSRFEGNSAAVAGGAVFGSTPTLKFGESDLVGNQAAIQGGAVSYQANGDVSVQGGTLTDNHAGVFGGALHTDTVGSTASNVVFIVGARFDSNLAGTTGSLGEGGAISAVRAGNLSVSGSAFISNEAVGTSTRRGGAIRTLSAEQVSVSDSFFCENRASQGGAVLSNRTTGADDWSNNVFVNNESTWGGAMLHNAGADLAWSQNTAVNNDASLSGSLRVDFATAGAAIDLQGNVVSWDDGAGALWGAISADPASSSPLIAGWAGNVCHDNNPADVYVDPAAGAPPVCLYTGQPAVADPQGLQCADFTANDFEIDPDYAGYGADATLIPIP